MELIAVFQKILLLLDTFEVSVLANNPMISVFGSNKYEINSNAEVFADIPDEKCHLFLY
jgi:hypothetical protein